MKKLGIWDKALLERLYAEMLCNLSDDNEGPYEPVGDDDEWYCERTVDDDFRDTANESSFPMDPSALDMIVWWDQEPWEAGAEYELSGPGSEAMLRTDTTREPTIQSVADIEKTEEAENPFIPDDIWRW
jgi:hypothetical protein